MFGASHRALTAPGFRDRSRARVTVRVQFCALPLGVAVFLAVFPVHTRIYNSSDNYRKPQTSVKRCII